MAQQVDLNALEDKDPGDMTKDEALAAIGKVAGFRGYSRTQLRKEDLNSVFWYLTGNTVCRWRNINTDESPSYILLRRAVADVVGFKYIDRWTDSRVFRVGELQQILEAMRGSEDMRDHAE